MRLFLTEKPKQAQRLLESIGTNFKKDTYKTHGNYMGSIYYDGNNVIIACTGHMLELYQPHDYDENLGKWSFDTLPFFFDALKFKPKPSAKATLDKIQYYLKKATDVVHVGDIDDEGQALIDNILRFYNYKGKTYRLWYDNETVAGFTKALANLQDNKAFEHKGYRAVFRAYVDLLVGFNLTRAYTLINQNVQNPIQADDGKTTLHIGRVKTPIIHLVHHRDSLNSNFKKTPYHLVKGIADTPALPKYPLTYVTTESDPVDDKNRLIDGAFANDLIQKCLNQTGKIIDIQSKTITQHAPKPFTAGTLQQACASLFGLGADETMQIAQSLKDMDLISYHRTDIAELSNDNYLESQATLDSLKQQSIYQSLLATANPSKRHPSFVSNPNAQFTHHGIIPLPTEFEKSSLNTNQQKVYDLICRSYLRLFMPEYIYISHVILTNVNGYKFKTVLQQIEQKGYKQFELVADVANTKQPSDESDDDSLFVDGLNGLKIGDTVTIIDLENQTKYTSPPPIYTEPKLLADIATAGKYASDTTIRQLFKDRVKAGLSGGLGTPATTSTILKDLLDKGYLQRNGKTIIATQKAHDLVGFVDKRLCYPDYTAIWQAKSENIQSYQDTLVLAKEIYTTLIVPLVNDLKTKYAKIEQDKYKDCPTHECPTCQGTLVKLQKTSKAGKPYTQWQCITTPSCPKFWDKDGLPALDNPLKS